MSKQIRTAPIKKPLAAPLRKRGVRKYSSTNIHRAIFGKTPQAKSLTELKNGIGEYIRARHGCR
jgi:hypothetical protein